MFQCQLEVWGNWDEVTSTIIFLLPPIVSVYENFYPFFFLTEREVELIDLLDALQEAEHALFLI